jgi:hypothetical protein
MQGNERKRKKRKRKDRNWWLRVDVLRGGWGGGGS